MQQIQANITGYEGAACSLFAAYDEHTRILVMGALGEYRPQRREGCLVITNMGENERDAFFSEAQLSDAIRAFYLLRSSQAADNKSPRLIFNDRAMRAHPESVIERDGMDERGTKYRIAEGITNAQIAALAICHYAVRSDTVQSTVHFAHELQQLTAGTILSFWGS